MIRYAITGVNPRGTRMMTFGNPQSLRDSKKKVQKQLTAIGTDARSTAIMNEMWTGLRVDAILCYDNGQAITKLIK